MRRFTRNQDDFFLAGRRNSSWVAGLAFLSANLGALELLGMAGNTFKYGMSLAHFHWIGAVPAILFLGFCMMPFHYSGRIKSVPGYLKLRFDEKTRVLNGIAFAIMTLLVSGINLYAMALVLYTFLGWNWDLSMWVSAATVAAYVTLSGLLSAIFTEIILSSRTHSGWARGTDIPLFPLRGRLILLRCFNTFKREARSSP